MVLLWLLPLSALLILAMTAILNAVTFPRLNKHSVHHHPRVSILIPARNEVDVIGKTVRNLLAQDWVTMEIILLDDESSDGTAEQAMQAAQSDARFRIIKGQPLPEGWGGKNWACHQLSQAATGDILIFTDADVQWRAESLRALLYALYHHKADMLTVWPTQITQTWAERLVVPLMSMVILAYLPEVAVRFTPWPIFAAANGQCLVFRRDVYEQIGGHEAVRTNVIEDVALAQATKKAGYKLVMVDGNNLVSCRMYHNWQEVKQGYAKNILAGHANSPLFLAVSTVFHWALFVMPWLWLGLGWISTSDLWPVVPLVMVVLGVGVRGMSAVVAGHRLIDSLFMPLSVVLMTLIAIRSLRPVEWKGRQVRHVPS